MASKTTWSAHLRSAFIAFFFTLVVASMLGIAIFGTGRLPVLTRAVDTEVFVLLVPVIALLLAIVVEAARLSRSGAPMRSMRRQRLDWKRHRWAA